MNTRKSFRIAALGSALFFSLLLNQTYAQDAPAGLTDLADKAGSMVQGADGVAPLDINSASADMLAKIPGIGPQLGEAITAYRDSNGKFSGIQDLLKIDGIDAGLLEKIKPFLKF